MDGFLFCTYGGPATTRETGAVFIVCAGSALFLFGRVVRDWTGLSKPIDKEKQRRIAANQNRLLNELIQERITKDIIEQILSFRRAREKWEGNISIMPGRGRGDKREDNYA